MNEMNENRMNEKKCFVRYRFFMKKVCGCIDDQEIGEKKYI